MRSLEIWQAKFHTFQLKEESAFRAVIKNQHFSTPVDDIRRRVENNGRQVNHINQLRDRNNKERLLPLFCVYKESAANNKLAHKIHHIGQTIVNIEPSRKTKDPIQCHWIQFTQTNPMTGHMEGLRLLSDQQSNMKYFIL